MGAGLGHVRRLQRVARALEAAGWEPWFAIRSIGTLADELLDAGWPVLQAPVLPSLAPTKEAFKATDFADIMAICGYADADALLPPVRGWDALLAAVDPAAVVADYCPVLPLATHGRVPMISFGDGFVSPPGTVYPFPKMREQGTVISTYEALSDNAARVAKAIGRPPPPDLAALYAGDRQVVATLPELDIYAQDRAGKAAGPLGPLPDPIPLPANAPDEVFVYLAIDFPHTRKVLQALINGRVRASVFIRGAPEPLNAQLRQAGLTVHDKPPPLTEALAKIPLIIHHGGIGTTEEALAIGRVQLLFPRHLEQSLNARQVMRFGTVGAMQGEPTLDGVVERTRQLLGDAGARHRAAQLANAIQSRRYRGSVAAVVEAVEALTR